MPVFSYFAPEFADNNRNYEEVWKKLVEADAADYIMAAGTAGTRGISQKNDCGIHMDHSYSILSVFTMTDQNGNEHKMLLMRDPFGETEYNWRWSRDDLKWNSDFIE